MILQEKALRLAEPPVGTILKESLRIGRFLSSGFHRVSESGHKSSEGFFQNCIYVHRSDSILELENKLLIKLQDLENFIIEHFYLLRYHFKDMKLQNYY